MKKPTLLLAVLLTTILASGQNIEIPDTAFLYALIDEGVDTDEDSLISFAEAEAVTSLNISGNVCNETMDSCGYRLGGRITSLEGIEAFTNLDSLDCGSNQISSLNTSNNTALKYLSCAGNVINSLNVSDNGELTYLDCDWNELSNLDVSNNSALEHLQCTDNALTNLDISNNTTLKHLNCGYITWGWPGNDLTSLDVTNNTALEELYCANNQLTSLDLTNNFNLKELECSNNQLSTLDLSNNTALEFLGVQRMPDLHEVCVWSSSSPPGIMVEMDGSTDICFQTDCNGDCSIEGQEIGEPFYPTNSEMKIQLEALAEDHSEIVQYHELGYATNGDEPIIAVKISDNVTDVEDEPVWVFTGFLHGDEQIGLRIVFDLAKELAINYGEDPEVTNWIDAYEIWLIMSLNPWGYEHDGSGNPDVSGTRCNGWQHWDPENNTFFINEVDLNRNFDFNWDSIGLYPGEYPFSENETQAFRDLYLSRKPVFGISFHQGRIHEGGQLYFPWTPLGSPDYKMLNAYGNHFADWVLDSRTAGPFCEKDDNGRYVLEDPEGDSCGNQYINSYHCRELCWRPFVGPAQPAGYSSTWAFAAVGTVDLMVEVSPRRYNHIFFHRPDTPWTQHEQTTMAIATEYARNHREGIKSWFQHFLYSNDPLQYTGPGITGHVTDAHTGVPLSAVVEVEKTTNDLFADRISDAAFGRFWRFLPPGKHVVEISVPGYKSWQDTLTLDVDGPLMELDIALTPGSDYLDAEIAGLQGEYHLSPVYPNPSHAQTQFRLTVKQSQQVEIGVFNLHGKKVATLHNEFLSGGETRIFTFETGQLPNALYLLQIRGKHFKAVKMMAVIQ